MVGVSTSPHIFEEVSESVSSLHHLLLDNFHVGINVCLSGNGVLFDVGIDSGLGNFERLSRPFSVLGVDVLERGFRVDVSQNSRLSAQVVPVSIRQRLNHVRVGVED